jgi:hypothetical protein
MERITVNDPGHLSAEIERQGDRSRFVVMTSDPLYQEGLEHLGYLAVGDARFATIWFPWSSSVPAYHERFAASIEAMVLQRARLVPVPWEEALLVFISRARGSDLRWWLYGSAALAVRSFDVEPGDIDINVSDATLAERIFDDLMVTPTLEMEGWVARRTGRAFDKAIVEWLSDPHPELDDPAAPHEQGPYIASRLETVQWRGHLVHVPPLDTQLRVCEARGMHERAHLIRARTDRPSP